MYVPEPQPALPPADDLLWRHLKSLPAFRALLRAVEARFYRHLEIPKPILDLGCGDGHFAAMAFDRPLATGVDPWWGPLQKARRAGVYRLNVQAMGDALPFASGTFASIISNSVLEHIPDVQPVLDEASRVLRPGGRLVITMPSHFFTENLGGAALLRPLGLANAYRRFFNRISRHAHTDPPQRWAQRLAQAGFAVERWQTYFSRDALHALEIGHAQGLPSAILHFLTGHWIVAPWRDNLRLTERWLRPFYAEEAPADGAYLLMVATKRSAPLPSGEPFEVRLPAPRPLPIVEPDTQTTAPPALQPLPQTAPATPVAQQQTMAEEAGEVLIFRPSDPAPREAPLQPSASFASSGWPAIILVVAGLFAAVTAQSTLAQRLPSPWAGVAWYAFALAAFAAAAILVHRAPGVPTLAAFSRRTFLLPLAFVLALLVQEQGDSTPFGGHLLLAFALWIGAAALAYYALATPGSPATGKPETALAANGRRPSFTPILLVALFLLGLAPRLLSLTTHPFIVNGIEASIGLDAFAVLSGQIRNPFATSWLSNPTFPLFPAALPLALLGRSILALRLLPALVGALTPPILFLVGRKVWGFWPAFTAAIFLAGYHLHLHYSRLGMTNVWDPLLALLIAGAISFAVKRASRGAWLWAGLAVGAGATFYTVSHLLPFFLAAFVVYLLFLRRDILRTQGSDLFAAAALALVVALPQIIYYQANPNLFMERANALGIFNSDWLLQQAAGGQSVAVILADQFRRALLAFNGSLDTSTSYNPGIPLLRTWPAIFFTLGVAVAAWRIRRVEYALPLIWLAVTLLFGGALLLDPPGSHRVLIAAPFVAILVAAGLFWLAGLLRTILSRQLQQPLLDRVQGPVPLHILAILAIALLLVAGDLLFYFGAYRQSDRFGDRNSEIAHEVGLYLDSLEGEWQAYFHGPPAMYVTFPTIMYLAERFQPGVNLLDVPERVSTPATEAPPGANLVFIYLPERSAEVNQTAERFPDGAFLTFDGQLQNPLFYSYEVHP